MFTQFRIRYPQGSLISEFVTVDRGQYIVRVLLQDKGITLATGLAAADTIEKAEDQARERAFAALGIDLNAATSTNQFNSRPSAELSQPKTNFSTSTVPDSVEDFAFHSTNSQGTIPPLTHSEPSLETSSFSAPKEEILPPKPQESVTKPSIISPVDMSDVMAKTDIEMKRLGWGKKEGVEHLLQTYGKRTRTSLTDGELQEFLQYLQSQ